MRRGQAEIIGLVLIVIILAIGFLLYIKFNVGKDSVSVKEGYEQTRFGSSFVTSLAKSTVECGELRPSVEELVRDIASGNTRCNALDNTAEGTLKNHITKILYPTLKMWGKNYWLRIVRKTSAGYEGIGVDDFTNDKIPENQRCDENMNRVADTYLIAGVTPAVEIVLYQCSD